MKTYLVCSLQPLRIDTEDVKIRTTGIYETAFTINGMDLVFIDVGGQRSERRKWMHCFSRVTAVIFCCAIDEYNMVLEEDETVNRFVTLNFLFLTALDLKSLFCCFARLLKGSQRGFLSSFSLTSWTFSRRSYLHTRCGIIFRKTSRRKRLPMSNRL